MQVHRSRSLMKCWDQYLCRMVGPTFETINSHRSAVPPLLSQLCRRLTVQTNDANKCQFTGVRDNKKVCYNVAIVALNFLDHYSTLNFIK